MNKPLAFDDSGFGAALCIGNLTYVREIKKLFAEFCRFVTPGGIISFI